MFFLVGRRDWKVVTIVTKCILIDYPVVYIDRRQEDMVTWWQSVADWCAVSLQVYEVNRKLLQEHAAPLMAVYLHGVAVVRQELNMDVGRKSITGVCACVCVCVCVRACVRACVRVSWVLGLGSTMKCVHHMCRSGLQNVIKRSPSQVCTLGL